MTNLVTPALPNLRAHMKSARLSMPVLIFLVGLVVPLIIELGPFRLSVYRFVLVIFFIPVFVAWMSGRAGRKNFADYCVLLICFWTVLSNMVVDGVEVALEPSGIAVIETLGAYLLARVMVRTPEQFYRVAKVLFLLVLALLPFALFETLTSTNLTLKLFNLLGPVYEDVPKASRWGLDRVQASFDHPILFGVFCSSALSLAFYVLGAKSGFFGRSYRAVLVLVTGTLSLSSGPLAAMMSNIGLIGWDQVFLRYKKRWIVLITMSVLAYVTIDLLSNRTPVEVLASRFAFNAQTAYSRVLIWEWGTKSIFDNPVFGLGLYKDWERLEFMTPSVDMFWILPAMRNGIVVWIAYFAFFFSTMISVSRRPFKTPFLIDYRKGYLICIFSLFVAGWTVHFWNATFVLFMFLMGCAGWFLDYKEKSADEGAIEPQQPRYKVGPILPKGYIPPSQRTT